MFKKAVIIAILIFLVVGLLVYMSLKYEQTTSEPVVKTPLNTTKVQKTATLFLSPKDLSLSISDKTPYTLDVMIDTGKESASGVQAKIKYDPKVLSLIAVTPDQSDTSFFGRDVVVLTNDIDQTNGAIMFEAAIPFNGTQKSGSGKLATITFDVISTLSPNTEITFLDTSIVTTLGEKESILKSTTGAQITIPSNLKISNLPTSTPASLFTPSPAQ